MSVTIEVQLPYIDRLLSVTIEVQLPCIDRLLQGTLDRELLLQNYYNNVTVMSKRRVVNTLTLHRRRNRGGHQGHVPPLQTVWYGDLFDHTPSLEHMQ